MVYHRADADYSDMENPAHITIRDDLTGMFQFGLVQGDIDARVSGREGLTCVEFSWSGVDENDPVSGRGWLDVTGDQAQGRIFIHWGDDSAFTAARQDTEAKARKAILQHDEDQLAQGKVGGHGGQAPATSNVVRHEVMKATINCCHSN